MSFSQSSTGYRLENGHILHATLLNKRGDSCLSTLDLNKHLGNQDGWFMWDGANYTHSGHGFRLEGCRLVGDLRKKDGGSRGLQGVDLDDRITNNDGRLEYVRK